MRLTNLLHLNSSVRLLYATVAIVKLTEHVLSRTGNILVRSN